MARVEKSAENTALSIKDFAATAIGALTAGAFTMAVKATIDRFNALGDAAAQMGGVTASELDRLSYIAEHTGSSADAATASMHRLTKAMGEAAAGVGGGFEAFKKLGISVRNADGSVKSITQVMGNLREKMKSMSVAQRQAAIQMLGMERTMIGLFQDDTTEIVAQYDKRTKALGLNVDELADKSALFNDRLGHMTRAFSDVMSAVVVRILPALTTAIETVTNWMTESGDTILGIITPFTKVINVMVRMVNGAMITLGGLIDIFGSMPAYVAIAATAWKAFSMLMNASPLGKAIAAISAVISVIGLLIDDFKTARAGGESFFQFWNKPFFEHFIKAGRSVVEFLNGLIDIVGHVVEVFSAVFGSLMTGNVEDVKATFVDLFASVKKTLSSLSDFILGIWDGLAGGLSYAFEKYFPRAHAAITELGGKAHDAIAGLADKVSHAFESVEKTLSGFVSLIGDLLSGISNRVLDWAMSLSETIVSGFAALFRALLGAVDSLVDGKLTEIGAMVTGWIDSIISSVKGVGAKIADKFTSGIGAVAGFFGFGGDEKAAVPMTQTASSTSPSIYHNSSSSTTTINNSYSDTFNVRGWEDATRISTTRLERRRSGAQ